MDATVCTFPSKISPMKNITKIIKEKGVLKDGLTKMTSFTNVIFSVRGY